MEIPLQESLIILSCEESWQVNLKEISCKPDIVLLIVLDISSMKLNPPLGTDTHISIFIELNFAVKNLQLQHIICK
jgi:hypothetical protein